MHAFNVQLIEMEESCNSARKPSARILVLTHIGARTHKMLRVGGSCACVCV